jgi:quinol monooxygenase YgiN
MLGLMFIVHVHVHVKPDCIDAFRKATIENAACSIREPGIARFDLVQQRDDPTHFLLVEAYRDESAPAAHKETPHYAKWRDIAEPMMARPRERAIYSNVFPDDAGW